MFASASVSIYCVWIEHVCKLVRMQPANTAFARAADGSETAKLLDFGIAASTANSNSSTMQTSTIGMQAPRPYSVQRAACSLQPTLYM